MELTPIKIPGKRRRKGEESVSLPPTKRPKETLSKRPKKMRQPRVPSMEMLPLEILERIFWFSEDVNLPRSSLRLGHLLSGRSTLRETFISAFGPTWEVWLGCVRDRESDFPTVQSYAGWEEDRDRFGGNPEFQSALLSYSWTTVSFILECWDLWVRRYAKDRPFHHVKIWDKPGTVAGDTTTGNRADSVNSVGKAKDYFFHDYAAFCQVTTSSGIRHEQNTITLIEVHSETRIPDTLLTGPWDEAALQKLFWLVRAGARLAPDQTWEITLEGFHDAITDTNPPSGDINLTFVRLLDTLAAFETWPKHVVAEEYEKAERICSSSNRADQTQIQTFLRYAYILMLLGPFAD
ncbi:hypothetical protein F4779DRAFT_638926 [Xylariaceae sp. FL0662B]|nr:hypothetical protein F4779DRAFT_638926 [Xylariaceae sp. FL0662B]